MKMNWKSLLVVGAVALAAIPMVACQTAKSGDASSAVMCDKCKTVWVKTSAPNAGGKGQTFRNVKTMKCDDCESALATFFKTGELKHTCATCGGTLSHCEH
jgi:ribosomal protein S27E